MRAAVFNEIIRAGNLNPFHQDVVVLCSYQFARVKEPYLRQIAWDLVVIDEAHRLRNVYKGSSKIAPAIKQAVAPFPKVLLTATPLRRSSPSRPCVSTKVLPGTINSKPTPSRASRPKARRVSRWCEGDLGHA